MRVLEEHQFDQLNIQLEMHRAEALSNHRELKRYFEDLDQSEKQAVLKDWRYRLVNMGHDLAASAIRQDWLLHTLTQEHSIEGLLDIIQEFNQKQLSEVSQSDDNLSIDLIDVRLHQFGLFLGKKSWPYLSFKQQTASSSPPPRRQ